MSHYMLIRSHKVSRLLQDYPVADPGGAEGAMAPPAL